MTSADGVLICKGSPTGVSRCWPFSVARTSMQHIRGGPLPILAFALLVAGSAAACATEAREQESVIRSVPVYLFWTQTCPHCTKARRFLEALAQRQPSLDLHSFEIESDEAHERAFAALSKRFSVHPPAVPLIVIGDDVVVGYDEDATTGAKIEARIEACRSRTCADVAAEYVRHARRAVGAAETNGAETQAQVRRPTLPETIRLPGIGEVATRSLSLPVLTLVLGAIDGFNPCAMWVLVFLIGLLVGMQDSFRMWSYGVVFLLTSAAVYFAFMTAWLNVFLLLGSIAWIRVVIGVFAVAAGGYYLWQFATSPDAACPVTSPGGRERVMSRLKAAVGERSFLLGVAGLVVLAVGVNMIELLCSAGVPAVYTQVLALSDLQPFEYYAYLTLYIAVFLLDDVVVFITAMVTLRAAGLAANYARSSHLIGGIVLSAIGILLLFKPSWLTLA